MNGMNGRKRAELRDIHKVFESAPDASGEVSRFTALDGVTLAFLPGEIHAILGENGAGKSTLVHILSGLHRPSRGCVRIGGQDFCFNSPSEALSAGVAMVHQRPLLADSLSVLENVILGAPGTLLHTRSRRREVKAIASEWELSIDLDSPASSLSAPNRLFAALLGALFRDPDFLILDEPTPVLEPAERDHFFRMMQKARARGMGIILITHQIDEAVRWSDRISVLRQGRLVYTSAVRNPEPGIAPPDADLLALLLDPEGHLAGVRARAASSDLPGAPATGAGLETPSAGSEGLSLAGIAARPTNRAPVIDASFTARCGTVTGIWGHPDSGIDTLEDILSGMIRPDGGTLTIGSTTLFPKDMHPARLRALGVSSVPSDRNFRGSSPGLSLADFLLPYHSASFLRRPESDALKVSAFLSAEGIDEAPGRTVQTLSGGQLQRLILARELDAAPRALILAEPEWGLDIGSSAALRKKLAAVAAAGTAVLILTTDPETLSADGLCSKVFTIRDGRIE